MNGTSAAVRLNGVSWTYSGSDTPVLTGLDLEIRSGETVLLCGHSGSGKSTALRLMNGLIPHLHDGTITGTVELFDEAVENLDWDALGGATGSVWQHPFRQFFTDRVTDEVAFGMENQGEPPGAIRDRVEQLLTHHGLSSIRHARLRDLSSGRQQQVATLAAIAHRPRLVLLDEPTANLDPEALDEFVATLTRLRDAGTTIVIAEHRIAPFIGLSDRVVSFRDGHVDNTWTGEAFNRLGDNERAEYELRPSRNPTRHATPITACGASISGPSDDEATPRSATGLVLDQVVCARNRRVALSIDHAHFPAGRVTAVRGINGAGKTTLARVLTGLQRHKGHIRLADRTVSRADRRRLTTLVPQEVQRQLYGDSVESELDLFHSAEQSGRRDELLRRLDLHTLRDRHPLSLSGGQQQRLAVAASVLSDRPIVILDEPSTGVDTRHLTVIADLVGELAEAGRVVVIISHDEQLLGMTADHEVTIQPLR